MNSTAASVLTCTQHLYAPLYGGPWDGIACATSLASDLAIAVMRTMSDNHWATDQLAGMTIGALIGWGVPYVMHHRRGARVSATDAPTGASRRGPEALVLPIPTVSQHGAGLALTGIF